MAFLARNAVLLAGYGQEAADQAMAVRQQLDAFARGEATRESAVQAIEAVLDEPWYEQTYLGIEDPEERLPKDYAGHSWREEMQTDYPALLAQVDAPVLLVYGTQDAIIPVERTLELLGKT